MGALVFSGLHKSFLSFALQVQLLLVRCLSYLLFQGPCASLPVQADAGSGVQSPSRRVGLTEHLFLHPSSPTFQIYLPRPTSPGKARGALTKGRVANHSCWRPFGFIRNWHVPHQGSAAASRSPSPESRGSSLFISFGRQLTRQPLNGIQQFCRSLRHPFPFGDRSRKRGWPSLTSSNAVFHLSGPSRPHYTFFQDKALREVTNSPTKRS